MYGDQIILFFFFFPTAYPSLLLAITYYPYLRFIRPRFLSAKWITRNFTITTMCAQLDFFFFVISFNRRDRPFSNAGVSCISCIRVADLYAATFSKTFFPWTTTLLNENRKNMVLEFNRVLTTNNNSLRTARGGVGGGLFYRFSFFLSTRVYFPVIPKENATCEISELLQVRKFFFKWPAASINLVYATFRYPIEYARSRTR